MKRIVLGLIVGLTVLSGSVFAEDLVEKAKKLDSERESTLADMSFEEYDEYAKSRHNKINKAILELQKKTRISQERMKAMRNIEYEFDEEQKKAVRLPEAEIKRLREKEKTRTKIKQGEHALVIGPRADEVLPIAEMYIEELGTNPKVIIQLIPEEKNEYNILNAVSRNGYTRVWLKGSFDYVSGEGLYEALTVIPDRVEFPESWKK